MTPESLAKDSSMGRDGLGMGRDGLGKVRRAAARRPRKGKTREEMRELWGLKASQIAKAYCDRRIALDLPPLPVGALIGQSMRLLDGGRWEFDTLLAAAVEFAGTKRFPGYFEEWASQYLTSLDLASHKAFLEEAGEQDPIAPDVLAVILGRAS